MENINKKLTIKEHIKILNNKYAVYLKYPIQRMKKRDFYYAGPNSGKSYKGREYEIYYYTSIRTPEYTLGLDIKAESLYELEKIIINKIRGEK